MTMMYVHEDEAATYFCDKPLDLHQHKYSVEISDELYSRYVKAMGEFGFVQEILCELEQAKIRVLLKEKIDGS